ncbi:DUF4062 domain-containing protein [Comamonas testosteroni]|uniref:DUF4062 domain-containing protein n=1 Tax=Comamonas testosteroni TaxID=285 RepID=UPI0026EC303F|nr:DUF4062 domain-containing protein [Comamonas testosteroni]WQD44887.1 DUF4062 domain-containing protein [Comamonas testosteroni]
MAKPRVFVSSTYYDLKHIRASIEAFITSLGYEAILFENGDIPFHHEQPLDLSCYEAIEGAHIFVLIIGGRYGSASSNGNDGASQGKNPEDRSWEFYNSITVEEYKKAKEQDIPIYIFLEKGVSAEYLTYKENKDLPGIKYAHVDNVNIFKLIDSIYASNRNNLVREFDQVEHITSWLKIQWAGVFADILGKRKSEATLRDLSEQVKGLNQVVDSLRSYSEAIVRKIEPKNSEELIKKVEEKLAEDIVTQNPFFSYISRKIEEFGKGDSSAPTIVKAIISTSSLDEFLNCFVLSEATLDAIKRGFEDAQKEYELVRQSLYAISALRPKFSEKPIRVTRSSSKQYYSKRAKAAN